MSQARSNVFKLRDVVNIKDPAYGAKGDGVTDDTAAIQAAIDSTKSTGANYGKAVRIPAGDATKGYVFSNLTLHNGAILFGDGSHRSLLSRASGSTGIAITDEGNPNKIICFGFSVLMNNTAGDGIDFLGDEANNVFGSEAWMDDVYVVRSAGGNFQTGTGIKIHANAAALGFVRVYGFSTNFDIRGAVCLAPYLISSNGVVNYNLVGNGHKIGLAYSESAVTTHVRFGDTTNTTFGCEIGHLAAHLLASATTPQVIHQEAQSASTQLNRVLSGTLNFKSGSVLTNLVNADATGFVEDITFQLSTNTHMGFFEWNGDKRANQRVYLSTSDANFDTQNFAPYDVYVVSGITAQRNFRLPLAQHSYGRTIVVKNNDDASNVVVRPHSSDGTIMYGRNRAATNNVILTPGASQSWTCGRDGNWYLDGALSMNLEGVQTNGDTALTLTPGNDYMTQRWATELTADRAVTLSTTGGFNGARFLISRPATGAFNLNVGTGPLKALAAGQWCEVEYSGAAWFLIAYGTL